MGEWADGKMTGHGEMRWADGRSYAGEWLNNRCNGKGTLTYKDGRRYEGEYKNDKMHGKGVYEWSEGARYLGPLRPHPGVCLYTGAHATCVCVGPRRCLVGKEHTRTLCLEQVVCTFQHRHVTRRMRAQVHGPVPRASKARPGDDDVAHGGAV